MFYKMDAKFAWLMCVGFVCTQIISRINAQSTHDAEGKSCVTPSGEGGVCLQLPQCSPVVLAITRGERNHFRCGFIGSVELVCCVPEPPRTGTTSSVLDVHTPSLRLQPPPATESSSVGAFLTLSYAENAATPTTYSTFSVNVETAPPSTAVSSRENFVEGSKERSEDIDNSDKSNAHADGIDERIFVGNKDRNRVSPTLFAYNTLRGFVNVFFGKPTPPPNPTKPHRQHITSKPPTQNFSPPTTPIYIRNRPFPTHKPETLKPPPTVSLLSTTHMPLLDLLPNEILPSKPKPSLAPGRPQSPTSPWLILPSAYPPTTEVNDMRPENPFIPKSSPLPSTKEPSLTAGHDLPLGHKPHLDETTVRNVLLQTTRATYNHTPMNSVQNPSTESVSNTEKNFVAEPSMPSVRPVLGVVLPTVAMKPTLESVSSAPPVGPDPEPVPPETSVRPDLQSVPSESSVRPDLQSVPPESATKPDPQSVPTEIPERPDLQSVPTEIPMKPDLVTVSPEPRPPKDREPSTSETSSASRPFSGRIPVGTKSKEACDRYKEILKLTRYIIGGEYAGHGEFPHMVALGFQKPRESNLSWFCGGTLLNEEYVLTAAHCVRTRYGPPQALRVGFTNLTADWATGTEVAVRDSVVHPAYNPIARAHDIALLRLHSPANFTDFLHPACLHAAHQPPPGPLIVTGWGSITADGTTPTDHLKKALITPVDDKTCWETYPRFFRPEMICAGSEDAVDTCKGDSGGPMQYLDSPTASAYTVVGVTSFGPNPCAGALPGVYSRVAAYLPWIEGIVWPN